MKKLLIISLGLLVFASCEKWREHKEKPCPVVASTDVPSEVRKSFDAKYPGASVDTWFNKDNAFFCALFKLNGNETRAFFNNDGSFEKEEIDDNQQGDHQDNDNDEGCECEIEDGD